MNLGSGPQASLRLLRPPGRLWWRSFHRTASICSSPRMRKTSKVSGLRNVPTGSDPQVLGPAPASYRSLAFSPDGTTSRAAEWIQQSAGSPGHNAAARVFFVGRRIWPSARRQHRLPYSSRRVATFERNGGHHPKESVKRSIRRRSRICSAATRYVFRQWTRSPSWKTANPTPVSELKRQH